MEERCGWMCKMAGVKGGGINDEIGIGGRIGGWKHGG